MAHSDDIAQLRRAVNADPRTLRFVQLGEALHAAGRLDEAEAVLERGLTVHPGLNRARLAQACLWAETDRQPAALQVLEELYPRDPGNVRLVALYLRLLVDAGRHDEARVVLGHADIVGVPQSERDEALARLDAASAPGAAAGGSGALDPQEGRSSPEETSTPGGRLGVAGPREECGVADAFAVPVIALRLERAGRLSAALDIWKQLAEQWPDRADIAGRVADLRFRVELGAETLDGELLAFGLPAPPPEAARPMLLRWRDALKEES
ncbi:MAG: tetratricopeptide repeat protein [Myxococcota bacterium]|nr:tetratricopeptide repeat protein [Myxococcota bacterium]MEC8424315.1 tetratricopeptide repeat protein [Myxococcota bacterium]